MLSRTRALGIQQSAGTPSFAAVPLEAGLGGCPWRIVLAVLLKRTVAGKGGWRKETPARVALAVLLGRWPDPGRLRGARESEIAAVLTAQGLAYPHRRARAVLGFNASWLQEGWETLLDLDYVSPVVAEALVRHVPGCVDDGW